MPWAAPVRTATQRARQTTQRNKLLCHATSIPGVGQSDLVPTKVLGMWYAPVAMPTSHRTKFISILSSTIGDVIDDLSKLHKTAGYHEGSEDVGFSAGYLTGLTAAKVATQHLLGVAGGVMEQDTGEWEGKKLSGHPDTKQGPENETREAREARYNCRSLKALENMARKVDLNLNAIISKANLAYHLSHYPADEVE